jgi:hypothetical protein
MMGNMVVVLAMSMVKWCNGEMAKWRNESWREQWHVVVVWGWREMRVD